MKTWRLIPLETHNAFMNMAIDEAILTARIEKLVPNTIRLYQWKPSAISIGKNQNIDEQVYPDALVNFGVDVVRRTSGGGAVYHDQNGEITYSVTAKTIDLGFDFTSVYEKIYSSITDSLRLLGISADFVEGNKKNCPNLTVYGKKISGSAQTVKRKTIQQHGTLLLNINLKRMFQLLRLKDIDCGLAVKIGKRKITSIKTEVKHDISVKTVANALEQGFRAILKANIRHDKLTANEKSLAKTLYEKKYLTKEWNNNGNFNSLLTAI
ncbi:MAG: lipoate--protein ligase family protein [Candidatus Bathyarchaeota archaeon]|jgi:lipoate-protein ligase A|nr:lipoate--protein ligase family protein [Candidatus Bathyarchaeota archaeon]